MVALDRQCTGILIHPEVVVFAAHCSLPRQVAFGESEEEPERLVTTRDCGRHPGGGGGRVLDIAYCRLAAPQELPIVPPLVGTEVDWLAPGLEVMLVGFGVAEDGSRGRKRAGPAAIRCVTGGGALLVGGAGADTCAGDSGGPVFVELGGSWRLAGVTAAGGRCGGGGRYERLAPALPWLEAALGLDLSPCHDAAGAWEPGPGCATWPAAPHAPGGRWTEYCRGPERPAAVLSEARRAALPDDRAPVLQLAGPARVVRGEAAADHAVVRLPVELADEGGCGAAQIRVQVDGEARAPVVASAARMEVPVVVPAGAHQIRLVAVDHADNRSAPVVTAVDVGESPAAAGCRLARSDDGGAVLALLCMLSLRRSASGWRRARRSRRRGGRRKVESVGPGDPFARRGCGIATGCR